MCFLFLTSPSSFFLSSSCYAFSSERTIRCKFLDTVNMWIVPLSDEQAIQLEFLSNEIEYISALSDPLLTSYRGDPSSVEKSLIRVPLSLAVASRDPVKLRAIHERDDWWPAITKELFFSYIVTLMEPLVLSGVAKTDMFGSELIAHSPFGLRQVSMASISLRSAKL